MCQENIPPQPPPTKELRLTVKVGGPRKKGCVVDNIEFFMLPAWKDELEGLLFQMAYITSWKDCQWEGEATTSLECTFVQAFDQY